MNDSVVLMSSMSPKIKNKLNPGERQFRRVAGVSILALKKNIRRSSIYDKSIKTTKNENLNIVESNSSISTESFPSLQLKESQDNSVVIIPDSNCSSESSHSEDNFKLNNDLNKIEDTRVKTEASCLLPKDKLAAISQWVANVNTVNTGNNTISSVYSDLSTICGTDIGKDFLPKKEGHAINSTFANGHDQGFDKMFGRQNSPKVADESVSSSSYNVVNESLKNIIIEDSFEILNQSLRTRLKISENNDKLEIITDTKLNDNSHIESPKDNVSNKWTSIQFSEESSSIIRADGIHESFKQTIIDRPVTNKVEVFETPKNNKWKAVEISDDSGEDETVAENLLDELYGNSWRINKDLILSKTEPRKRAKKPSIKTVPNSESKPKFSLLYKNPYLDIEKSKSQNLLESLHKSKRKEISKSPWHKRLKDLCDSDTPSEDSLDLKNFHNSKTKSSSSISGSDSYKNLKVTTNKKTDKPMPSRNKNQTKKEPKHETDKLVITSGKNKIIANNGNSSSSNVDLKIKTNKNLSKTTSSSTFSNSSDSYNDLKVTTNKPMPSNKNIVKTTSSSNRNKIIASTSNSSGSSSDLKVKTNKNPCKTRSSNNKNKIIASSSSERDVKIVTKKKIEINITTEPTPSRTISVSSDEEWEEQVSRIERRLTIADDGTYSFLASLSASVPIIKCDMSARLFRNNYKTYKDQLLKKLFKMYNEEVFDNVLSQDMPIEWSEKLRKTAGCCFCKKITKRTGEIQRTARIVLSTKVLDAADRMRDTLIHEMCHAATWIVNCVADGHGDYWKSWAFKAMKKFPDLPPIKRCHNYAINTKYTYKCTGCGYSIGRHSKSLDIERKRCGYCLGKFEVLVNKTNKKGETKAVAATPKKEATGFALYVKENYGIYKNPLRKHGDVMKILGQKFKEMQVNKL